jgi:DNA repair protein RecO (recombination protein O)
VLRKYDYSEHSQILRLFTRGEGMLSVLAKGVKKEKSSFGGALDVFYLGRAAVLRRSRASLEILGSFRVETAFPGLREVLPRFLAACHLAEILSGMVREAEPHTALFDDTVAGLRALEGAPADRVAPLLVALELGTLKELGFAPSLTRCAHCDAGTDAAAATLSVRLGGVLCPACGAEDPGASRPAGGTLAALRTLERSDPPRALRVLLSPAARREIRAFLDAFEEWRMERPLRTARFLREPGRGRSDS